MKHYPELKEQSGYTKWRDDCEAYGRADGIEEIFDPHYWPQTPEQVAIFRRKQAWAYAVLRKCIKTPEGTRYVQEARRTFDAQRVLFRLHEFATRSTHAVLDTTRILTKLTSMNIERHTGSQLDFITKFRALVTEYNDQQTDPTHYLAEQFLFQLLKRAVQGNHILNDVKNRELERMTLGGPAFTFDQYYEVLKSAAISNDSRSTSRRRVNATERDINVHEYEDHERIESQVPNVSQEHDQNTVQELIDYAVHQVMQRRRPSLNKTTWSSLSQDGKTTWDQMSDEDKAKITAYVDAKLPPTEANHTEIASPPTDTGTPDAPPAETVSESTREPTFSVNQVVANALNASKNTAHPGDLRRSLAPQGKPPKSALRKANVVEYNVNTIDCLDGDLATEPEIDDIIPPFDSNLSGGDTFYPLLQSEIDNEGHYQQELDDYWTGNDERHWQEGMIDARNAYLHTDNPDPTFLVRPFGWRSRPGNTGSGLVNGTYESYHREQEHHHYLDDPLHAFSPEQLDAMRVAADRLLDSSGSDLGDLPDLVSQSTEGPVLDDSEDFR